MSLLIRINVAFGGVFVAAAAVAGYAFWGILEGNARREVLADAGLMLDSALATRAYTASEILPLLSQRVTDDFTPQSVPFYAATQNFLKLHERHPAFSYKEATLNPTNPRDRAADWEADVIQRFKDDARTPELIGERDTPMGRVLFLARPIRAEPQCAACHSVPAAAPRALIARYGSEHGFGWQTNEIVGAQIVSVPFAEATHSARRAWDAFMWSLLTVFGAVFLVVNAVFYVVVVKPVRRIARITERVSLGDATAPELPRGGAAEIVSLTRSFDRMRKSLDKALRLLDGAP